MKKLVYLIFVLSIFSCCIENKPVIKPLDEDDIISLITEEANLLKTIYFDCKEFEDVVGVVVLYYKKTFVTMIYKEEW